MVIMHSVSQILFSRTNIIRTVAATAAITTVVIGILALLASNKIPLGPFNGMSRIGNIGGGVLLTGGVVLPIVIAGVIHFYRSNGKPFTEIGVRKPLTSIELQNINSFFQKYEATGPVIPKERRLAMMTSLQKIPECVDSQLQKKDPTVEDRARSEKIIGELAQKYEIAERDGTTWGFDTVLMRGLCTGEGYDSRGQFDSSMTTCINKIFSEGMKGNGYRYSNESPTGSKYVEELEIDAQGHNWLVSASFDLEVACRYATRFGVGNLGLIFLIHAPAIAMQDELYGVNLSGGGKQSVGEGEKEVAFVFVPPDHIIGALPVYKYGAGMAHSWTFLPDYFIANPLFYQGTVSFNDVGTLGLDPNAFTTLKSGSHAYTSQYYEPRKLPHYEEACKKDRERLQAK